MPLRNNVISIVVVHMASMMTSAPIPDVKTVGGTKVFSPDKDRSSIRKKAACFEAPWIKFRLTNGWAPPHRLVRSLETLAPDIEDGCDIDVGIALEESYHCFRYK